MLRTRLQVSLMWARLTFNKNNNNNNDHYTLLFFLSFKLFLLSSNFVFFLLFFSLIHLTHFLSLFLLSTLLFLFLFRQLVFYLTTITTLMQIIIHFKFNLILYTFASLLFSNTTGSFAVYFDGNCSSQCGFHR